MGNLFIEEETFEKRNFSESALEKGTYELCVFLNCNFSNSDISNIQFLECEFQDCNLSSANLSQTGFQDILFKGCKMLGMQFDKCSDFGFSIKVEDCQLNLSSFYQQKLLKTVFSKSKLQEVAFTECNLSSAIFEECDLLNALFINSDLRNADFRNAYNYTIDPETNRMKGAKFNLQSVSGLLTKYNIIIES